MLVGLLTGHINLQYALHEMERAKTFSCRRCGAEKEISAHIQCEWPTLEKVRILSLGSTQIDPNQINEARLRSVVALGKEVGLLNNRL